MLSGVLRPYLLECNEICFLENTCTFQQVGHWTLLNKIANQLGDPLYVNEDAKFASYIALGLPGLKGPSQQLSFY